MKKKLIVLLLLASAILHGIPAAGAASPLCFVAMNDTIPLTLTRGEAPFYSENKLYIPYTAFNVSPNGVGATYNPQKSTFVLFNRDQTLIFRLDQDLYTDSAGKEYPVKVVFRGGMLYVPANVLQHFDLSVILLYSRQGHAIVRFLNGSQVYDDGTFVAQAENLINRAAAEYEARGDTYSGELLSPQGGNGEDPLTNTDPVQVYPALLGSALTEETLSAMDALQVKASFFLTDTEILSNRALVRKAYAAGHTVALTADPAERDFEAALRRANDALQSVLFYRTVFVLVPASVTWGSPNYCIVSEGRPLTIEAVMESLQQPQLYVIRDNGAGILQAFSEAGAVLLRLKETTF